MILNWFGNQLSSLEPNQLIESGIDLFWQLKNGIDLYNLLDVMDYKVLDVKSKC